MEKREERRRQPSTVTRQSEEREISLLPSRPEDTRTASDSLFGSSPRKIHPLRSGLYQHVLHRLNLAADSTSAGSLDCLPGGDNSAVVFRLGC
ncbi:hypothetical protein RRG08_014733 [Elysia crispata]|uniref:Uncharacterized protein n=1 Tax=Elysia crispata TaxID=231223 RepID=A0AAE1AT38_9GAST|nr:hypothetical protein RRG08_014733 [Elysia crispata]